MKFSRKPLVSRHDYLDYFTMVGYKLAPFLTVNPMGTRRASLRIKKELGANSLYFTGFEKGI